MKIAVFYRDAFASGGVPGEIAALVNAFSHDHKVFYWGSKSERTHKINDQVNCYSYEGLKDLYSKFKAWLLIEKPDVVLIIGFFMIENTIIARLSKKYSIPVVLNPLVQLVDVIFQGKIFTKDPDVRALEKNKNQKFSFKELFLVKSNSMLKYLFLKIIGSYIIALSDAVAIFSKYEECQFYKYFPSYSYPILTLKWGIDDIQLETESKHFFNDVLGLNDNKANYVYWGRLDWTYKGIDRLLKGILSCKQTMENMPFRLFLIGPDYRGGADKVKQFIEKNKLQDAIFLMLPGSYPAGSKQPLRDATASIYLSRWDGFPRTLRESFFMNVPIIASAETHFTEVINEFQNGLVVLDSDNEKDVAEALIEMSAPEMILHCQSVTSTMKSSLSWLSIARNFIEQLCLELNLKNESKVLQ